jgi:hypothetical protein
MRIGYAGDRQISVDILSFILSKNTLPLILIVPDTKTTSHSKELISMCNYLNPDSIILGSELKNQNIVDKIKKLNLDYMYPFSTIDSRKYFNIR